MDGHIGDRQASRLVSSNFPGIPGYAYLEEHHVSRLPEPPASRNRTARRQFLLSRDGGICLAHTGTCQMKTGRTVHENEASIDELIPKMWFNDLPYFNKPWNQQIAHRVCNSDKGAQMMGLPEFHCECHIALVDVDGMMKLLYWDTKQFWWTRLWDNPVVVDPGVWHLQVRMPKLRIHDTSKSVTGPTVTLGDPNIPHILAMDWPYWEAANGIALSRSQIDRVAIDQAFPHERYFRPLTEHIARYPNVAAQWRKGSDMIFTYIPNGTAEGTGLIQYTLWVDPRSTPEIKVNTPYPYVFSTWDARYLHKTWAHRARSGE